jgi:hypothetical protein
MHVSHLLLALALPLAAFSPKPRQSAVPTGVVTLAALRDTARPLLIFAPRPDDPQLEIQLRRLNADPAALAERNVVLIAVPYQSPSTTPAMLSDSDATAARRRFNIAPPDFTVILLGKDGGEKLRSTAPIILEKLRDTIDAMPMRQDEMRSKTSPQK